MKVHSIFQSIDGEVCDRGQGSLSTFVRLSGCNLRCSYCDIPDAQTIGVEKTIEQIREHILFLDCPNITITGGEPLLQDKEVNELILGFLVRSDKKWNFSIETNGTIDPFQTISWTLPNVSFVVDYKLPSSGCIVPRDFGRVYGKLRKRDWVKFVIADEQDYEAAKHAVIKLFGYPNRARLAFSPAFGTSAHPTWPLRIAQWMMRDGLWHVVLNIQIHKLLDME